MSGREGDALVLAREPAHRQAALAEAGHDPVEPRVRDEGGDGDGLGQERVGKLDLPGERSRQRDRLPGCRRVGHVASATDWIARTIPS